MAEAEARLNDLPVKEAVETAMQESLDVCREILQDMASSSGNCTCTEIGTHGSGQVATPGLDMNFGSDFDALFDFDFSDARFNFPMQWSNFEAPAHGREVGNGIGQL